ncbi:MAG: hypothetical protein CVV41_14700 [Candidatus Riflebacteria bacterium HGW-Riflebacteria-1]|nr:MAG: hypothetical protein CVV41_14700 [Candidatus Riflebacteria bacterium HGW-Riflebacteria-1]
MVKQILGEQILHAKIGVSSVFGPVIQRHRFGMLQILRNITYDLRVALGKTIAGNLTGKHADAGILPGRCFGGFLVEIHHCRQRVSQTPVKIRAILGVTHRIGINHFSASRIWLIRIFVARIERGHQHSTLSGSIGIECWCNYYRDSRLVIDVSFGWPGKTIPAGSCQVGVYFVKFFGNRGGIIIG